jgi:hypothetical protein
LPGKTELTGCHPGRPLDITTLIKRANVAVQKSASFTSVAVQKFSSFSRRVRQENF